MKTQLGKEMAGTLSRQALEQIQTWCAASAEVLNHHAVDPDKADLERVQCALDGGVFGDLSHALEAMLRAMPA